MKRIRTTIGYGALSFAAWGLLLAAAGCSFFDSYPERIAYARQAFVNADFIEAAHVVEEFSSPERDRVLLNMELGTIYHTMGHFEKSNDSFLQAVQLVREYEARAMVSLRDVGAFGGAVLINDKARPYRGAPYERVLLHTYLAMNFLLQRKLLDARVEILQAYERQKRAREEHDLELRRMAEASEEKGIESDELAGTIRGHYADQQQILEREENIYQNAFTYYLSVLVYELNEEYDDAYIDAKTVYALNPDFSPVHTDLLRLSRRLGLEQDYRRWRRAFGQEVAGGLPEGHGEVVLLVQSGMAPLKEQIKIPVPVPVRGDISFVTVSIPKFRAQPGRIPRASLHTGDRLLLETCPLMDVRAAAVQHLWDQAPAIAIRQILRASGRYAAIYYAREKGGDLLALLVAIGGYALEQADLRSWATLPKAFQVGRAHLPAGQYAFRIGCSETGAGSVALERVPVRAGGMTFIVLRCVGNRGTASAVVF